MTDYFEDIKKMISEQFGIPQEDIEESSRLDEDLRITELDLEDLTTQIQSKYDVKIPQDKSVKFEKVSDIVSFLYDNVGEAE